MITAGNFKTITQLRLNTLEIITSVINRKMPIYVISRSKPKVIIIDIDQYGKFLELERENKELKKKLKDKK